MDRRVFLSMLALGTAELLAGCASPDDDSPTTGTVAPGSGGPSTASADAQLQAHDLPLSPRLPARKRPTPTGQIDRLPGRGDYLALTVDDGASSEVVGAYTEFAKKTGAHFTFFVTGQFDSWRDNRAALRPLVESGQIQLGNHTWTHADLTASSASVVADELSRTQKFLRKQYGVESAPYFRPPYGYHNATVDKVAADLGYSVPVLWYGSLSDSGVITEKYLLSVARQYLRAQRIVIGHANHAPVTHVFDQLAEIIRSRKLQTVTLNDYFEKAKG